MTLEILLLGGGGHSGLVGLFIMYKSHGVQEIRGSNLGRGNLFIYLFHSFFLQPASSQSQTPSDDKRKVERSPQEEGDKKKALQKKSRGVETKWIRNVDGELKRREIRMSSFKDFTAPSLDHKRNHLVTEDRIRLLTDSEREHLKMI